MSACLPTLTTTSAKKLALSLMSIAWLPILAIAARAQVAPAQSSVLTGNDGARTESVPVEIRARAIATASAARSTPVIDGRDIDEAWRSATPITAFRAFDPTEDADPAFATEARITYDAANLFVFVRAVDPHPDSIIALMSRRDVKTTSDQIKVMIDSYHDRRTGYEFAVNAAGVKRDYYTYDDSQEDVSWDAVWDVVTRIDSLGWTAEFRIPLNQLRYAAGAENQFGVMIMRDIARRNERVSWPLWRKSKSGIASQFADVGGFMGLPSPRRLELSPYALTRNKSVVRGPSFA